MTKSELIQAVSERQSIPKKRAEEIVNAMFAAMAEALIDNRRIEVRGFGSFSIREYEARLGRNPRTNETVHVDAKRSVHFKVGKELRDLVSEASIELQP